jgi:DNA replication licensing factor MCM4
MESDVYEALELMKIAIHQTAIDPLTGKIDMDVLVTGKTSALRQKILNLSLKIK